MSNSLLQFIDVNKSFFQGNAEIAALKDVNLTIKNGEFIALIGPSGSGKTTLLQVAGLLDSPDKGVVIIDKINVSKASDEQRTNIRKNKIGFVYQFHHLMPEFSAIENVALPLLIQGKNKQFALQQAKEILGEIGLSDRLNHKPAQLSGGQQQRVALARAIITKPSLILADEPTGNLDSESSHKVFELLLQLTKENNIGCLVVTHNLELAKKADRRLTIKDGAIS